MTSSSWQEKGKSQTRIHRKNTAHFITLFKTPSKPVSNREDLEYLGVDYKISKFLPIPNGKWAVSIVPKLKFFLFFYQLINDWNFSKTPACVTVKVSVIGPLFLVTQPSTKLSSGGRWLLNNTLGIPYTFYIPPYQLGNNNTPNLPLQRGKTPPPMSHLLAVGSDL